jgi:hypothetical protein
LKTLGTSVASRQHLATLSPDTFRFVLPPLHTRGAGKVAKCMTNEIEIASPDRSLTLARVPARFPRQLIFDVFPLIDKGAV